MKVVVSAVAFSQNKVLVDKLRIHFPNSIINETGKRFSGEELIKYYSDAEAIITGVEKIDDNLLIALPKLKIIAKYGVGLDNIDLKACENREIKIGWTSGVNKYSVAEMTIGLMLMLFRNLSITSKQLKEGTWNKSGGRYFKGSTVGIIGMGNIGKELVRLLSPFGVKIIANDITDISEFAAENNLEVVSKEDIYKTSDIITIHTPLTSVTKNLINFEVFEMMKNNAFVINTARGGIVNEADLKSALRNNRIAGAAIDVYEDEPPTDQELLKLQNLICTPHIAGNAYEAVLEMGNSAIKHLLKYSSTL